MRILLTGGTGMLGRQVIPRLAGAHEVFVLARGEQPDPAAEVRWVHHDLSVPVDRATLPDRIDAVVHLAQSQRYMEFPEGAEDIFAVNVQSTSGLLEYARRAGARCFVLASTGGVYEPSAEPIPESAPVAPSNPYTRSKRIAELLLDDYASELGGVVLRFFFVYGPGRRPTLVSRLAERILAGEQIQIEGDPGMRINPIFAEDAARAVEAAVELNEGMTINVAGRETVSVSELATRLARALDREPSLTHTGDAPPADLVADTSLMRAKLGVEPEKALDEGLATVARSLAVS
jgi:UDP-glucose 4-epimerase